MRRLLLLLCVSGCPEVTTDPTPLMLTPYQRDLQAHIVACTGCHGGDDPDGGLNLSDLRSVQGQDADQLSMPLIDPGNHRNSYLWHKVNGSHSIAGGLGARMPAGGSWDAERVQLLATWIDLGCPP